MLSAFPGARSVVRDCLRTSPHSAPARVTEVLVAAPAQDVVVVANFKVGLSARWTRDPPNVVSLYVRIVAPRLGHHEVRVHLILPFRDGFEVEQRAVSLAKVFVPCNLFPAAVTEITRTVPAAHLVATLGLDHTIAAVGTLFPLFFDVSESHRVGNLLAMFSPRIFSHLGVAAISRLEVVATAGTENKLNYESLKKEMPQAGRYL